MDPDVLRWTVWPARERPWSAAVLVAGALVLGVLIARSTGDRLLAVAAPLFVLASLGSFLFPTDYRLTRESVDIRSLGVVRVRSWTEVRRVVEDATGVLLSPFSKPSWLDSYRGLRLQYGGNRDQVLAFVEAQLAAARSGGDVGGGSTGAASTEHGDPQPGAKDRGPRGRADSGG